jgi:TonB family protein
MLIAEDYRHSPGFSLGYPDGVKPAYVKEGWEPLGEPGYRTMGDGLGTRTEGFRSKETPPTYVAVMYGPLRNYEVKFVVQATTSARLEEVLGAIKDVTVRPDWVSQTPPPDPNAKKVRISQGVAQGLLSKSVAPKYPDHERSSGIQGTVLMLMNLDTTGHVQSLFVTEGNPALSQAAVRAVSQWEYRPYLVSGQPVNVETLVQVRFQLH